MRSMLNVEATLGLWLLGNMNNWKKLLKGLLQRPLEPYDEAGELCLGPCILQHQRLQQKAARGQIHSLQSIPQLEHLDMEGGEGWGWPQQPRWGLCWDSLHS